MKTSIRLLGATLGATAIVGTSAFAANACDFGGHDGARDSHSSASAFPSYESGDQSSTDQGVSFAQKQAAIVQRLTDADARLTDLISTVSDTASTDPSGGAAQELSQLKAHQAKLESLISAVKAATNEDELKAAFENAFSSTTPTSITPSDVPAVPAA
jgi:hypothetical protein